MSTSEPRARRASMADVARLARVSSQTVSRVSNGYPGVVEETRQQVLLAMKQLDYRPNAAARALKWGEFRTIGVIMFTLSTSGNIRTLDAIASAAAERGYAITLIPVTAPTTHGVQGAFNRLGELAVDAVIIIMEAHLIDESKISLPPGVPVVIADSEVGHGYAIVDTDQRAGAQAATVHLLDLGHRNVWHIGGPAESYAAQHRIDAWAFTLTARGIEPPPLLRGDWSAESGYEAGKTLVDEPDCTAIFVANDQMALGVLRAFWERGRKVPADVSVVGFDDSPESASYLPPLTTVHQDFAEVGRLCIAEVLRQIRNEKPSRGAALVPVSLVVRESTAPPRTLGSTGTARGA